jgi:hypothetical protein
MGRAGDRVDLNTSTAHLEQPRPAETSVSDSGKMLARTSDEVAVDHGRLSPQVISFLGSHARPRHRPRRGARHVLRSAPPVRRAHRARAWRCPSRHYDRAPRQPRPPRRPLPHRPRSRRVDRIAPSPICVNSAPRRTCLGGKKARRGGRRRVALMSGVERDAQGDVVPCGGAVAALGGITARPLRDTQWDRRRQPAQGVANPPPAVWLPATAGGSARPRWNGEGH